MIEVPHICCRGTVHVSPKRPRSPREHCASRMQQWVAVAVCALLFSCVSWTNWPAISCLGATFGTPASSHESMQAVHLQPRRRLQQRQQQRPQEPPDGTLLASNTRGSEGVGAEGGSVEGGGGGERVGNQGSNSDLHHRMKDNGLGRFVENLLPYCAPYCGKPCEELTSNVHRECGGCGAEFACRPMVSTVPSDEEAWTVSLSKWSSGGVCGSSPTLISQAEAATADLHGVLLHPRIPCVQARPDQWCVLGTGSDKVAFAIAGSPIVIKVSASEHLLEERNGLQAICQSGHSHVPQLTPWSSKMFHVVTPGGLRLSGMAQERFTGKLVVVQRSQTFMPLLMMHKDNPTVLANLVHGLGQWYDYLHEYRVFIYDLQFFVGRKGGVMLSDVSTLNVVRGPNNAYNHYRQLLSLRSYLVATLLVSQGQHELLKSLLCTHAVCLLGCVFTTLPKTALRWLPDWIKKLFQSPLFPERTTREDIKAVSGCRCQGSMQLEAQHYVACPVVGEAYRFVHEVHLRCSLPWAQWGCNLHEDRFNDQQCAIGKKMCNLASDCRPLENAARHRGTIQMQRGRSCGESEQLGIMFGFTVSSLIEHRTRLLKEAMKPNPSNLFLERIHRKIGPSQLFLPGTSKQKRMPPAASKQNMQTQTRPQTKKNAEKTHAHSC
mmetsp:Transcript_18869/g.31572  ORF Transcript_18869/g.31572 Transcript_18869/m.31572 type:complete len:662 (+) Transcript_18869:100-2085(+)